ncbi:hypothetical protein LAV84_06750 [Rhizobium sp. VS19-DR104.2]|uniref:hypothetical protein n=1 Tax=unclassified Rhizobium TaxID=2613769 RepID=UPI001CC45B6C|nr:MULTISPECIES: hypothetical protein [unclassified Rhizobium]MBZ5760245.1 hypothetical protein [Rhizobium sp. VS19-DR96]MBZ5766911.1 hypothetical protein [Rhizobium sp. VS19-DR129.2]MBZ5773096.1 hypothetical protein [Rhizobium sp. VS19-DRK62.2]MBZ5784080.1 hypothetical protein [Rhizobium sp. VS19-DR121]MBZ5802440.1 hypothetical protein [Rhizobium sp. VS19-DR181]
MAIEPFFCAERPCPYPADWQVACPSCSEQIACEMDEDTDGSFSKTDRDGDPVVNCDCFFIPSDVSVAPMPETKKMPPPLASKLGDDGAAVCRDASNNADGYEKITASYEAGFHGRAKTSQSGHEMQSPATGFGGSEKPRARPYYDGITQRCPDILMGVECRGPGGPVSKFPEGGE